MITLLLIGLLLIMLSGFYGLMIHYMFHFLLNFIGKLIPWKILFTFYNIVFTFAGVNQISVTKIFFGLLFVVNIGQVGGGLVLFATHEPASGLWNWYFGQFKLLSWLGLRPSPKSTGSCGSLWVISVRHAARESVTKPFFFSD